MVICNFFSNSDFVVKQRGPLIYQKKQFNSYDAIIGVQLNLLISTYIDPKYLPQAELSIKNYFIDHNYKFNYSTYSELAIISKNELKTIKEHYALVGKSYEDHLSEINNQLLAENVVLILLKKIQNQLKKILN